MILADPKQALIEAIEDSWENLFDAPTCSAWTMMYWRLAPELSSVSGEIRLDKYQADLLDCLTSEDASERIVCQKSARSGWTTSILAALCYLATAKRSNTAVFLATDTDAKAWAKDSLRPSLEACEPTKRVLETLEKGQLNLLDYNLAGKTMRVRGAQSPVSFRRISYDTVFADELDNWPLSVNASQGTSTAEGRSGEGNPVSLLWRGCRNSPSRKMCLGSSPVDEASSIIHDQFMSALIRFSYFVACPHCDVLEPLRWAWIKFPKWKKGRTVDERAEKAAYWCCHCKSKWRWKDLPGAIERGRFQVPVYPTWERESDPELLEPDWETQRYWGWHIDASRERQPVLRNRKGKRRDFPSTSAFHLNALVSTHYGLASIVRDFLEAKDDVGKLKVWEAHSLGLAHRDSERSVNPTHLQTLVKHVPKLPEDAKVVVVSADVQKTWISVGVFAFSKKHMWILDRKEFVGVVDEADGSAWQELKRWLMEDPVVATRTDGLEMRPDQFIVDTGYATKATYDFMPGVPVGTKYLVKGSSDERAPIAKRSRSLVAHNQHLWLAGVHQGKRDLLQAIQDSRITILDEVAEDAVAELHAERLVTRKLNGRLRAKFIQVKKRNELLDLACYARVAIAISSPAWSTFRMTGGERKAYDERSAAIEAAYERKRETRDRNAAEQARRARIAAIGKRPLGRWSTL